MTGKLKTLIAVTAVAGLANVATAIPLFPSNAGLYLYDTATGTGVSVALTGNSAAFTGNVGDYNLEQLSIVASGTEVAGGAAPQIDLNIGQAYAGAGASTLQIFFSVGTFGPTDGSFTMTATGPSMGSAETTVYMDSMLFGQGTDLGSIVSPGSVSGLISGNNYYLTLATTVTGTTISQDTYFGVVPDGGTTVMLLGAALCGLGLLRRKLAV